MAEKNFARVLRELDELADELEAREGDAPARAARLASEARNAIQAIFNERHRLAKLTEDSGETGAAELDLDAARAEIGRRLALLRKHRDAAGVPDGSE
ncbi:MAG: hypothetical protein KDK10_06135 [Maritimibacter sp.]|nr:hypothetical protein [Maritimibacter sp.]